MGYEIVKRAYYATLHSVTTLQHYSTTCFEAYKPRRKGEFSLARSLHTPAMRAPASDEMGETGQLGRYVTSTTATPQGTQGTIRTVSPSNFPARPWLLYIHLQDPNPVFLVICSSEEYQVSILCKYLVEKELRYHNRETNLRKKAGNSTPHPVH